LAKSGVLSGVSVGFQPLKGDPLRGGGTKYTAWFLMEISVVSVPCNPNAIVINRGFASERQESQILPGQNPFAYLDGATMKSFYDWLPRQGFSDRECDNIRSDARRAESLYRKFAGERDASARKSKDTHALEPDPYDKMSQSEASMFLFWMKSQIGQIRLDHISGDPRQMRRYYADFRGRT
jgi:hypothetical protein